MLEGTGICKSFGGSRVLSDVCVEVHRGEIVVLIGPSGSGKTTLLKIMSMLEPTDAGRVTIDGKQYLNTAADAPWPKVTAVFQQLFMWPHLSIEENITLPIKVQKRAIDRQQLNEMIELFDMSEFMKRFPNEVSGGQRQRAALVRAIMLNPEYILLDEITSALDVEQVAVLVPYVKELAKRGIGILAITHLLHFARETADRVLFMDGGRILESGCRQMLVTPKEERVKKFMSVMEFAR